MQLINDDSRRIVKGYGSVEVYDRQGELIPISEIKKFMKTYFKRGAPIHYNHSNQPIGKGLDWDIVEKDGHPALELKAEVYDDYNTDDDIWNKVKDGVITGFSIGGGRPHREVTSKGAILYDTPVWEFSLVERPANQESVLTAVSVAKSDNSEVLFVPLDVKKEDIRKPGNVDEEKWKAAKEKVKEEYKDISEESDKFYPLVQTIYQNMIGNTAKADYEPKQLIEGFKTEMEHWDTLDHDPSKVLETVLTHLKENKEYYTKLEEVEKSINEVNKMAEGEKMPEAAEEKKPTMEERMANLEKAVEGLMKATEKAEEPKDKKEIAEEAKEEGEPVAEETDEEKEKRKEEEMEKMKKAIIEEVKKELAPKEVAKSLDIPSVTTDNNKLEELHKQLGF